MSVYPSDFMDRNPGVKRIVSHLGAGITFVFSVLKWILLLNIAIGWLIFWSNLVRLHLSMGDDVAAILTTVLFIGPVVVAFLWRISWRIWPDSISIGVVRQ